MQSFFQIFCGKSILDLKMNNELNEANLNCNIVV